jgi:flagellar basal-body rod protein FlgC
MVEAISAREIAVSGLRAQRTRMNVIANNIANALTTRTPGEGGAFRRQLTVLRGYPLMDGQPASRQGVQVKRIVSDPSPLRPVFDPGHPDADTDGYVHYPNINMAAEMVDLISAQRAYEANVAVLASGSRMQQRALDMLQS